MLIEFEGHTSIVCGGGALNSFIFSREIRSFVIRVSEKRVG